MFVKHYVQTYFFALYTADCRSTDESCPVVKFADDTELIGKISNDEDAIYHKQIENFVNWCDKNYLYLNVSKTKELCIDYRKNQRYPPNQSTLNKRRSSGESRYI